MTSEEEFAHQISVNLTTAFNTVKAAARHMPDGGSVVLLSSVAARAGLANHEAVAAAKAGVAGLALSAAASYVSRGLRFNVVSPGLVQTPMTENITRSETARKASLDLHPLGRLGEPRTSPPPSRTCSAPSPAGSRARPSASTAASPPCAPPSAARRRRREMANESCVIVGAGISGLLAAGNWATPAGASPSWTRAGASAAGWRPAAWAAPASTTAPSSSRSGREVRGLVNDWLAAGAAAEWSRGFADAEGNANPDGHPRYRGSEGMTSIPKHLAAA
jgi:hypothetical protein